MTSISLFVNNLAVGGAQRVIANLSSEFYNRGRDIEIVLMQAQGDLLSDIPDAVPIVNLNTTPFIPAVQALRRYIRQNSPDVLISTINMPNLVSIIATELTNTDTRHIVRMANTPSKKSSTYSDGPWTDRLIPFLMRFLYPRANQIIALSHGLADDLVQGYGVDPARIEVIYNPTVTDKLLEKAQEPVNHEWFNDSQIDVVLGVGSLSKQKAFPTLLRAFASVKRERSTRLLILGGGPERSTLEALCGDLGITDRVELPGAVANPYRYMANADVFALSSQFEGCPNVLIEAMACGCPVVATDCPNGPSEILEGGRYGPLVPVGDDRKLAEALEEVLEEPLDSDLLRTRAQDFHVCSIANLYEEVIFNI